MRGSHAPSLRTLARRALVEEIALPRGARVLVACSGGPDSCALLHVLCGLRRELGLEVIGHGVDHGLRPEAAAELAVAAALARDLDVPFEISALRVDAGPNLQARARDARYEALARAMRAAGATHLATAHTADDRAETVLLRLLRGAGARGLAVLPARDGDRVRPLIRARRAAVLLHLERHGVRFARDPSNLDVRFGRTRVREQILPGLEAEAPRVVDTLCRLADELGALPPPPAVIGELGRAQREIIARAVRTRRTARVRVDDCKEVLVVLRRGEPVITEQASAVAPSAPRRRRSSSP